MERQEFLDKINENPLDGVARDIFADWLDDQGEHEEANRQRAYIASRQWLTDYACRLNPYDIGTYDKKFKMGGKTPDEVFEIMLSELQSGEIFAHGTDLHSLGELENPDEFFRHSAIVLGYAVDPDNLYYGCSC